VIVLLTDIILRMQKIIFKNIPKNIFRLSTEFKILILEEMLTNSMRKLYSVNFVYGHEVIKMKELKGWPFEPLDGDVEPLGEGSGGGPGMPN